MLQPKIKLQKPVLRPPGQRAGLAGHHRWQPSHGPHDGHNLPWFAYYADGAEVLDGSQKLKCLKSVGEEGLEKGENPLPENASVFSDPVINLTGL